MSLRFSRTIPLIALAAVLGCSSDNPPQVRMQLNELVEVPDEVFYLQAFRHDLYEGEGSTCFPFGFDRWDTIRENGGSLSKELFEHERPFRMDIMMMEPSASGTSLGNYVDPLAWVTTGRIQVRTGERRVVDATVYPTRNPLPLSARGSEPAPRFLHTSTELNDGRVLITGGFGVVDELPGCVGDELGTFDRCFRLRALPDAHVWSPARGEFIDIAPLSPPRAGHTATMLPNGEVLLVGGATQATLGVGLNGDGSRRFVLVLDDPSDEAALSYTVFTPEPAGVDLDYGDDPSAGTYGETRMLMRPRFMHATAFADRIDRAEYTTLIAGGVSNPGTFEVIEVLGTDHVFGDLQVPRHYPSAVTLETASGRETWIVGGVIDTDEAVGNDNLVETWVEGATTTEGGDDIGFPNASLGLDVPRYSFLRPTVIQIASDVALVEGFYGGRCRDAVGVDSTEYEWSNESDENRLCDSTEPNANGDTSFMLAIGRGDLLGTDVDLPGHAAFGEVVTFPNGAYLITGGIEDAALTATARNQLVLDVADDGLPFRFRDQHLALEEPGERGLITPEPMNEARIFHRSTAFAGAGVLTTGGMRFTDTQGIELVGSHELRMYPQVALRDCYIRNNPGATDTDGGTSMDAGAPMDAGVAMDAGEDDASIGDAGAGDAAAADAGPMDGGA